MSLFKLEKNYFDSFKMLTKPKRIFTSGSGATTPGGPAGNNITGSVKVFPLQGTGLKEVPKESNSDAPLGDSLEDYRLSAVQGILADATSSYQDLENYMRMVNSASVSVKRQKAVEILRFEPSFKFTSDTLRKRVVQDVLLPFYRPQYGSTCNWGFSNYHTLNFFSTREDWIGGLAPGQPVAATGRIGELAKIPSSSVLIYPSTTGSGGFKGGVPYLPTGSFSFEFYINPRYSSFDRGGAYRAGTLFHMSSSYAISLVSGSSRDVNDYVDGFRLLLQLSSSADIPPSLVSTTDGISTDSGTRLGNANYNLLFSSSDNSLKKNHWHYCCIRWSHDVQNSTGSFYIDGKEKGTFLIPDSNLDSTGSLQQTVYSDQYESPPDALFVGNYYDGPNNDSPSWGAWPSDSYIAQFFNPKIAYADGIANYYGTVDKDSNDAPPDPGLWKFSHPLNAEVHELKIYERYRFDSEIVTASIYGMDNLDIERTSGLLFYVPPFFVKDTNFRQVFQTPFQTAMGSTDDPFNVPLSFGVGGHYLNLENFTKEYVKGIFPRLWQLSGSTIDTSTGWQSCNYFLNTTGSVRKRNLTVLPNDNGRFSPNFLLLKQTVTSSKSLSLFVDDSNREMLSLVSLNNLLPTGSIGEGLLGAETAGSISEALAGPTPDDPSLPAGQILTIYNRTRDPSSNEVVFFDASNLFYGNKIDPLSYVLRDPAVTGSAGRVKITLKDNGKGNLYRADTTGSHATWATVGTILYDEGVSVVKAPTIPRFGKDNFEISLAGQQNIYSLRLSVPAMAGGLGESVNPTFKPLAPSNLPSDKNQEFTYITNVNLLDENLNVICKTNYSQAIVKRVNDRFMIRIKLDF